jgi:hypothetical protein
VLVGFSDTAFEHTRSRAFSRDERVVYAATHLLLEAFLTRFAQPSTHEEPDEHMKKVDDGFIPVLMSE